MLFRDFLTTKLYLALEQSGFLDYVADRQSFSVREASLALKLRSDLLDATCEYLAERGIFTKDSDGFFHSVVDYRTSKDMLNYFLAYKPVCDSFAALLDGSKLYGKDVRRDGTRLGSGTRHTIPYLVNRFKELGITSALDIGCGMGNFLMALAESIPQFRGIGVDIDEPVVAVAQKRFAASPFKNQIRIIHGDAAHPESFPPEVKTAQAIYGAAILHEFNKEDRLIPLLREYKRQFPRSKLFIIELDTPEWDDIRHEPDTAGRELTSTYRLLHYFSEQGLPQSISAWRKIIAETGWKVKSYTRVPHPTLRMTVLECE